MPRVASHTFRVVSEEADITALGGREGVCVCVCVCISKCVHVVVCELCVYVYK